MAVKIESWDNIIVDLDGTLAFDDKRRPLIESHGWEAYFGKVSEDEPNSNLIHMLSNLFGTYKVFILTGRCESSQGETRKWLFRHNVPYDKLLMRPESEPYPDFTKALEGQNFLTDKGLKTRMLEYLDLRPTNTVMVFDDRDEMTEWWREQGFSCCQVRPEGYLINPQTGEVK